MGTELPAVAGPVERGVRPLAPKRATAGKRKATRSKRMREAGYTRRPSAKTLPSDE